MNETKTKKGCIADLPCTVPARGLKYGHLEFYNMELNSVSGMVMIKREQVLWFLLIKEV